MKLTRERLKQIIKEELEETMLEGGDDESPIPGSAIKNLPPPGPLSKPKSEPSRSGPPPIAKEIFALRGNEQMTAIINTVGNLISDLELGRDTKYSLQRLKDVLSGKP